MHKSEGKALLPLQVTKVGKETACPHQTEEARVSGHRKDEVVQQNLAGELDLGHALSRLSEHHLWQKLRSDKGI